MTTALELGTMEKVDIRKVWPTEHGHFTPWLGENLDKLGAELGLELELVQTEAPVGGYSLDVLATDIGSGRHIVIENQFGSTDHDHFGKLLTYAAGYDAYAIVWITETFREEHREALDLLNRRTGEDIVFFGIEVELWKIGNSPSAPNFKLVAFPNEWSKQTGGVGSKVTSPLGERYKEFYGNLIERLVVEKFSGPREAPPNNVMIFGSGFTPIKYRAYLSKQRARVAVYIDNNDFDWNKDLFDQLEEEKTGIETGFGEPLEWERSDNIRASRILISRNGGIENDPGTLVEIQDWMVDRLLKFKEVFGPRLAELVD